MNREEFIIAVERTSGPFRRFLTALCLGDTFLADDIAQESLIKAYLASDSLTKPDRFKAWLYQIGYNTFISSRRSRRETESVDSVVGAMTSDNSADSPFRYEELYRALDGLSEKERTSILLFYMEGYSVDEISTIVGAGQSAVKQHLSRGRSNLRRLLENN